MSKLFVTTLNMSVTASYVIIAVMLIRLLLKKAPKVISYALWSLVAFRLICPFSFESIFSLMPKNTIPISQNIIYEQSPEINSGINNIDQFVNNRLPMASPAASINPIQVYIGIGVVVWVIGIIGMLLYSLISIMLLKKKLKEAEYLEENIYEASNLKTPFVLGVIRPKIYLPLGLSEDERYYILQHERTHIKRYDHIVKLIGFFILALHWFNPLVWLSFILMGKDMELSCDEQVLRNMDGSMKKTYANSLLSLATGKPILNGGPLAFGEGNVKSRIKNVLNYKKAPFWIIIFGVIVVVGAGIALLTNPKTPLEPQVKKTEQVEDMETDSQNNRVEASNAQWFLGQMTGADMPILDYASDDTIIFHGYFGLFVYDLEKREMIRSLDLKAINCDATQGGDYCDVVVSQDGNTVYLHPVRSENMYVYIVSDHSLVSASYTEMAAPFRDNFVFIEDVHEKLGLPMGEGGYAYNVAELKNNEYGYLYSTKETLETLYYRGGNKLYNLFGDDTVVSFVESVSPSQVVISYENPTGKEVLYRENYILEKLAGMEWITIPHKPGIVWRDIQHKLGPDETAQVSYDMSPRELESGRYRIIKAMKIGSTYIDVITEFEVIKDIIILDSGNPKSE